MKTPAQILRNERAKQKKKDQRGQLMLIKSCSQIWFIRVCGIRDDEWDRLPLMSYDCIEARAKAYTLKDVLRAHPLFLENLICKLFGTHPNQLRSLYIQKHLPLNHPNPFLGAKDCLPKEIDTHNHLQGYANCLEKHIACQFWLLNEKKLFRNLDELLFIMEPAAYSVKPFLREQFKLARDSIKEWDRRQLKEYNKAMSAFREK
jgi:hypothetical protein